MRINNNEWRMKMELSEVSRRLDELATAYVDKTGKKPASRPQISIGYIPHLYIYTSDFETSSRQEFRGETFLEMLDAAHEYIEGMPSEEEANKASFLKNLTSNIDVAFINPLTALAKKLSENAITHVKDGQ